jgi:enolase-phosphatase E1
MIQAILLDIEGTTTPIDFVHKTLFPYTKEKMSEFVRQNFGEIQTEIAQLRAEYKKDFTNQIYGRDFREDAPETVAEYLKFLIDADRKSTPLKSLQGKIWRQGYEAGELVSEVFDDVPKAFERWQSEEKAIAIYSSGSRLAQQLLFRYTNRGDLTGFIAEYFDTHVGPKRESESYRRIASLESFPPVENFLFVSDAEAELDAAREAGMETLLAIRPGNAPLAESPKHRFIRSFDEIP